eukprot:CAMPEP_0204223002 /NCGR_PEP_ID=MMETSP0361-20130328/82550_1 /ASSEMBLY_ACC=CAM_ASM_000343 /TAXON_ID=268821 /ORGANISM="Scrippsiella Hangoei, Strain SHTV-5" /LENGTH=42 /DNA_ID= /DNA_START= /DNA_END= /DNA_ORIENTATION=
MLHSDSGVKLVAAFAGSRGLVAPELRVAAAAACERCRQEAAG